MSKTTLKILDETNIQFTDLSPECRRKLIAELEYYVPGAQYSPSVKLGRWSGKRSFIDQAGRSYFNLLDRLLPIVQSFGYDVVVEDHRNTDIDFVFDKVAPESYSHVKWPEGHQIAGQPIMLKEHQVEIINSYLDNLAGVRISPTGSGKCLGGETKLAIDIDENSDFGKFLISKLQK